MLSLESNSSFFWFVQERKKRESDSRAYATVTGENRHSGSDQRAFHVEKSPGSSTTGEGEWWVSRSDVSRQTMKATGTGENRDLGAPREEQARRRSLRIAYTKAVRRVSLGKIAPQDSVISSVTQTTKVHGQTQLFARDFTNEASSNFHERMISALLVKRSREQRSDTTAARSSIDRGPQ